MAAGNPNEEDWFAEFKKLNAGQPASSPASPPSSAPRQDSGPASPRNGERRRHSRFEIDEAIAELYKEGFLSLLGVGKNNLARSAVDVSEGGAQFLVHERLAPGTKVKVRIEVEKFNDRIETAGVVRWCFQSARKKEDFFVGVQFSSNDPAQDRKVAAMRTWFTSPQYKANRQSRLQAKPRPEDRLEYPK